MKVTYLLNTGVTYSKAMVAAANARSGIWVDYDTIPGVPGFPLEDVAVSTTVESLNGVPLVVERSMWWPGDSQTWHEAHNSAGATHTGQRWALAEGEVGGERNTQTYVLMANTSNFAGKSKVTLLLEGGGEAAVVYDMPPRSRTTAAIGPDFGAQAAGRRFGVLVEALPATPGAAAPEIVVERAMYSDAGGVNWAAGTNAIATRLSSPSEPPVVTLTVSTSSWTAPAAGGSQAVTVTASVAGGSWTASSGATWLSVAPSSGTGTGSVTITAAPSASAVSRSGTVSIAGRTISVTQSGALAAFTLDIYTTTAPADGGFLDVTLTSTLADAPWTASSSSAPWLTVSPTSGTGSGTVRLGTSANLTGASRSATATVAGRTIAVSQVAATPSLSYSPMSWTAPAAGGAQVITVTSALPSSAWTASTSASWLTLTRSSGIGSGSFSIVASANATGSARSGYVSAPGVFITVLQPSLTVTPVKRFDLWGGSGSETFLGSFTCIFCTEYTSNSVNNDYGTYGSEYSSTSIRNRYSQYGSPYSTYSACNEYASSPPKVFNELGVYIGELTVNKYRSAALETLYNWLDGDVCM